MAHWNTYVPDYPVDVTRPLALARAVSTNVAPEMSTKTGIYHQTGGDIVTAGLKVRPRLQSYATINPQYANTVIQPANSPAGR